MKSIFSLGCILLFTISLIAQGRFVAVTFDDLPVSTNREGENVEKEINNKILAHIAKNKIPAIGFVNEVKLFDDNVRDKAEVDLLRQWLDAGLELGNHTYSHADLNKMTLDEYEKDVLKGEIITKELLQSEGKQIKYFRHPYLETGDDLPTKLGLNKFLKEKGYTIAPVTIEASDWTFSDAYDKAFLNNDLALMKKIGAAYVQFSKKMIDYYTTQSVKIFGRNIKQVLLVHANSINADYFGKVVEVLKQRGYKFVSLKMALQDKVYRTPEKYVGEEGISWIERWAITLGKVKMLDDEPKVPKFVLDIAGEEN